MEDSPSLRSPTHMPSHQKRMTRQNTIDGASNTELAQAQTRMWIEECTGCVQEKKSYREYLQDGTLLCELIETIQPGLIRKINRVKSPFAWRENLSFFLEACQILGLKGSQLFCPEDLQASASGPVRKSRTAGRGEEERRLRNVAVTLFWLGRTVQKLPSYSGPQLDLDRSALGEIESPVKSPRPVPVPVPSSLYARRRRSFTSPEIFSVPNHLPSSSVDRDQKAANVKVRRVQSVVARTCNTDKQSSPQIVLYLGKSHKLHPTVTQTNSEDFSIDQLAESEKGLARLANTSRGKGNYSKLYTPPVPSSERVSEEVVREQAESYTEVFLAEGQNPAISQKFISSDHSLHNGRASSQSRSDSRDRDSATPLSEISTVTLHEQASSCCSNSVVGSEDPYSPGRSEFSETESSFNVPVSRHGPNTTDSGAEKLVFSHNNDTLSPSSTALNNTPEEPVGVSSSLSIAQLSNSPGVATVNSTGLLPLVFKGDLSQDSGSAPCFSPQEGDTAASHVSLTQSQPEKFNQLSADSIGTSPKPQTDPVFEGEESQTQLRDIVSAQDERVESIPHSQVNSEVSVSESTSSSTLTGRSLSGTTETFCEESVDAPFVTVKEPLLESQPSSASSSSCSVIVVAYSNQSRQGGERVSDIPHTPANVSYNSNYSSDENENSPGTSKVERKQINSETTKFALETDFPDSTDLVDMAGILTAYPSPSNRITTVPHHSLNVPSMSGPDSPSFQRSPVKARTLCVIPSMGTSPSHSHSHTSTPLHTSSKSTPSLSNNLRGYQEHEVQVILLPGERRLGFNVEGGRDQGTHPRVGAITGDSPAARSSLTCGDELLAVNGLPLHNTTHSEATDILHEAASNGKIVLKIKRPLPNSLPRPKKTSGGQHNTTKSSSDLAVFPGVTKRSSSSEQTHSAVSALKLQAMDISRVSSDALPQTMHAKVVYERALEEEDAISKTPDTPDFLSDVTSTAVEIGSSVDDSEKLSMSDSHRSTSSVFNEAGSHGELNSEHTAAAELAASGRSLSAGDPLASKSGVTISGSFSGSTSILNSILEVVNKRTDVEPGEAECEQETKRRSTQSAQKSTRPISAPIRSVPMGGSYTLPHNLTGGELWRMKEKRVSLDEEREKRRTSIEEGTRAALQYMKHRKTESLPRQYRSASLSRSLGSEEEFHSSHDRKSSSPSVILGVTSPIKVSPETPPTPLNLRNMSIDETREASFNQMDEIWRQVESGSDDFQLLPELENSYEAISNKRPHSPLLRPAHMSDFSTSSSSAKESDQSGSKDVLNDEQLSPVRTNSSTTAGTTSQLQGGLQHHSEPSDPEVITESDVEVSLEETPPQMQSTPIHGVTTAADTTNGILMGASPRNDPSVNIKPIDSLLDSLRSLNEKVGTHDDDEGFRMLEEMLRSNTFKKAKEFHDGMRSLLVGGPGAPRPVVRRVVPASLLARQHFHHHIEPTTEVDELRGLLRQPHVQALLFCHDRVATGDLYVPDKKFHRATQDPVDLIMSPSVCNFHPSDHPVNTSAPLSRDVPTTRKENATIIFLERSNRPLGCTIYKQEDAVFIGKLLKGCDAEQSEMFREGDELLEVNGVPVMGRSTDEIVRLMSSEPGTTLAFTIIPVHDDNMDMEYEPKYVRVHFNYDGRLDDELPCKALGLSFQRGDIMEISNQDDPDWWQACKIFDDGAESLPGLIPARRLQQKREALVQSYPFHHSTDRRKGLKSIFSKKKKKKIFYQQVPPASVLGIGDEVPTYEDVVKLEPDPDLKRPIVLIGAPGVGRRTLIRKLLNSDTSHFAPIVQHTTRPIRPGEVNGHDYHFVTREEFEREVQLDQFLEYGDLRGHYYGTSFSSVKKVAESGRVPVLDLNPQALKLVRHSGLMPFVVFIASPRLERLHITRKVGSDKQKRRRGSSSSPADLDDAQVYTETELHHLVNESRQIEAQYGHYFDWVIMNDDFQVASDMLKEVVRRLEDEPQWVPAGWMQDL